MTKVEQRAITYSLLAHINNNSKLVRGPIDIFIPLIKKSLSKLNDSGISSGKSLLEIKKIADEMYEIDFPIPVIERIMHQLASELNTDEKVNLKVYKDGSFQILDYSFSDFDDEVRLFQSQIEKLNNKFKEFCQTCEGDKPSQDSILHFIEKNKVSLSRYLAHKKQNSKEDFTVEAQFVEYFKETDIYETVRRIYLGSILSGLIEYKTDKTGSDLELVFDTNFIIALLDLNTQESTHTCNKIVEVSLEQGYKLTVLRETVEEAQNLLRVRAANFNSSFLAKKVYPEDIYNACERRKLTETDLYRYSDNINSQIEKFSIEQVWGTEELKRKALAGPIYLKFLEYKTQKSALHDALLVEYVNSKRKYQRADFIDVNCWLVNNAYNRDASVGLRETDYMNYQPISIKADDFLNIIWLSNPQLSFSIEPNELSEIGLMSLVSMSINENLPKFGIIKELDDNIFKYAKDSSLTDKELLLFAKRVAMKNLTDLEALNETAAHDKEEFVRRLHEEAKRQEEVDSEHASMLIQEIKETLEKVEVLKGEYQDHITKSEAALSSVKTKDELITDLNRKITEINNERLILKKKNWSDRRERFVDQEVHKWQKKIWPEVITIAVLLILFTLGLLWLSNWSGNEALQTIEKWQKNLIFACIFLLVTILLYQFMFKKVYDRFYSKSNINSFRNMIKFPDDLKEFLD